jgi:hypothetical protein
MPEMKIEVSAWIELRLAFLVRLTCLTAAWSLPPVLYGIINPSFSDNNRRFSA